MKNREMSILDAFLALEELDDEDVLPNRTLTEGKSFNVRDMQEMQEADDLLNKEVKQDVTLEVIDPDADALEHLKDNKEYIGQIILQCKSCNATHFVDADSLVEDENEEGTFNKEEECPHCHNTGNGFHVLGQVGAVKEEEPEVSVDNDSLTDEVKFDNDETETTGDELDLSTEEETTEETVEEPEPQNTPEEPSGEPEAEEDFGAELEETSEEEDSDIVAIDTDEEKKDESLEESIDVVPLHVSEFLDTIIEPENVGEFVVFDLDEEDTETQVFSGTFDEIPMGVVKSEIVGFNTAQGKLIVRVSQTPSSEAKTLREVLRLFDDPFNEDIIVVDDATEEEVASGSIETVLEAAGDTQFESFEAPERVELRVRAMTLPEGLKTPFEESFDPTDPVQTLISDVLKANSLREHRCDKVGTNEYWLAESIRNEEDLNIIYENFIQQHGEQLIKEFKNVTGYKTQLDLLTESKQPGSWTEEEAMEEAKALLAAQEDLIAVIYGFVGKGGFKALEGNQLMEISTQKELRWATEMVERDYDVTGSVRVLYRQAMEQKIREFKSRKEMAPVLEALKNNNRPYVVKRSLKEGYRYTVLVEAPVGDEVIELGPEEVEAEVVTNVPAPAEQVTTTDGVVMDPRDVELVDKLSRIARDISDAIANAYDVDVDQRAILGDLIQDLQLVSGQLRPEDLPNTPLNELTREMYAAYDGFYEALDGLLSFVNGRRITTTQAQKLEQAVASLDSELFTTETINQRVRDPQFLLAMRQASVPGVTYHGDPRQVRLIGAPVGEELEEAKKKDDELPVDPEAVKTGVHTTLNDLIAHKLEAIDGYEEAKAEIADTHVEHKDDIIQTINVIEDEEKAHIDELISASTEIPFDPDHRPEPEPEEPIEEPIEDELPLETPEEMGEEVEFDEKHFQEFLNKHLDGKEVIITEGSINEANEIFLSGVLKEDLKETPINITLVSSDKPNELIVRSECLKEELRYLPENGSEQDGE